MNRIFVRENEELLINKYSEKIKIGLVGLGEGVGNTFIATALAFSMLKMGKTVSFVEVTNPACRRSLLYDEVAMDKRFSNRRFFDFYRGAIEGDFMRTQQNRELGINWCLATPQAVKEGLQLDHEAILRLITGISGEVGIYDIDLRLFPGSGFCPGGQHDAGVDDVPKDAVSSSMVKLLTQMDVVIGVVEPMPSKMLGSTDIHIGLERAAAKGVPLFYVVNKDNRCVVKKEVHNFLRARDIVWIPLLASELFFHDQYNCKFHWNNKEIAKQIMDSMDNIVKKIENITKHSH